MHKHVVNTQVLLRISCERNTIVRNFGKTDTTKKATNGEHYYV